MTSPYAKGLFQKGIVQSGSDRDHGSKIQHPGVQHGSCGEHLKESKYHTGQYRGYPVRVRGDLEKAAAEGLTQTGEQLQIPTWTGDSYAMDWEPVVDGDFLPTDPVTDDSFAEAGKDIRS